MNRAVLQSSTAPESFAAAPEHRYELVLLLYFNGESVFPLEDLEF